MLRSISIPISSSLLVLVSTIPTVSFSKSGFPCIVVSFLCDEGRQEMDIRWFKYKELTA